jgi:hypothetical protein
VEATMLEFGVCSATSNGEGFKWKIWDGVQNLITCKWEYDYKTWLGMRTLGKLLENSRHRPRWWGAGAMLYSLIPWW